MKEYPMSSTFVYCKTKFNTEVSGSGHTAEALPWIKDVEMTNSVDDLKVSRSILGRIYLNFETLDVRIVSALKTNILNSNFKKKAHLEEQQAQKEDRFLRDRKIAYLINEHFRKKPCDCHPQKVRFEG